MITVEHLKDYYAIKWVPHYRGIDNRDTYEFVNIINKHNNFDSTNYYVINDYKDATLCDNGHSNAYLCDYITSKDLNFKLLSKKEYDRIMFLELL